MIRRMLLAIVALVGALIAAYLTLYKFGVIGTLACSNLGSCELVQTTRFASFLGFPVAMWGVGYYLAVLVVALAGTSARWGESAGLSLALVLLTGWGVLFSGYLTWLELFVIHAICLWCVTSALLALTLFVIAWLDWRSARAGEAMGAEA